MSETLGAPWIADYLIHVAETYGGSLSNVPIHVKPGRKVQLLKFLTFRQFAEDDCVWAYVSDKHQQIAVRFSRHALDEYDEVNQGKRLTQERSAIATIKSFKPIFQRIPTGTVGKMTVSETLALNVDHVQTMGAAGEPEFGSPRTLDNHNELNDWIEGLRAGDGSGNVLKLRKEKRLAQERGESSVTETPPIHERRNDRPSRQVDFRHYAAPSEHKAYAKQEDWRESIAKKPLRFYKRPTGNSTSIAAPKPSPTVPVQKNGNLPSPAKRNFKPGNGALDPDSSPDVFNDRYDGSPSRSVRQTTPSEWPTSPEQTHIPVSPSREVVDQLPISPPSTPPLFTQELPQVVGQSTLVPEPAGDHDPRANPKAVQQAGLTSLRPPVPVKKRTQSVPLPSSSSAVSSVTTNLRHKATSLPTDVFGSTVSHTRRVPPPSAKTTKEPCGEVLVPGSDSGGPDTQSTQNNTSPNQRRVAIRASLERVNEAHEAQGSVLEPGPSQEPDKGQLDELSRMALNGSYVDHVRGNGVMHNGMGDNRRYAREPGLPSPEPELSYEQLPPSSLPIYSQSFNWDRSMVAVEETAAVEGTPSQVTTQHLPTSTTKRARPLTPSPPQGKRPRLMSYEFVNRSREVHSAAPRKVLDPELLKVGIEVDLTDYDGNPPPYPCKEGMSRLNFKQPHPSLITNSKLAEIWKSVCEYRGWSGTQSGELQVL